MTHDASERGVRLTIHNANKAQLKFMVEDRDSRIRDMLKEIETLKAEQEMLLNAVVEWTNKATELQKFKDTVEKRYGISTLPETCMAYSDGYRYGAYRYDFRIVEFFKNEDEIQSFVNENPEYGRKDI